MNQSPKLLPHLLQEINPQLPTIESFPSWDFPHFLAHQLEHRWLPAIEVCETNNEYLIKVEVPNMKPEDIEVEILGNTIILQGEAHQEKKEGLKNVHRSELRYGCFYRQIPLNNPINTEHCRAEFSHGMLHLLLPKTAESKRKKLTIPHTP